MLPESSACPIPATYPWMSRPPRRRRSSGCRTRTGRGERLQDTSELEERYRRAAAQARLQHRSRPSRCRSNLDVQPASRPCPRPTDSRSARHEIFVSATTPSFRIQLASLYWLIDLSARPGPSSACSSTAVIRVAMVAMGGRRPDGAGDPALVAMVVAPRVACRLVGPVFRQGGGLGRWRSCALQGAQPRSSTLA